MLLHEQFGPALLNVELAGRDISKLTNKKDTFH